MVMPYTIYYYPYTYYCPYTHTLCPILYRTSKVIVILYLYYTSKGYSILLSCTPYLHLILYSVFYPPLGCTFIPTIICYSIPYMLHIYALPYALMHYTHKVIVVPYGYTLYLYLYFIYYPLRLYTYLYPYSYPMPCNYAFKDYIYTILLRLRVISLLYTLYTYMHAYYIHLYLYSVL